MTWPTDAEIGEFMGALGARLRARDRLLRLGGALLSRLAAQHGLYLEDFPLALQVKQNGAAWLLHTIIAAIHAPTLYAAGRLLIER